MYQKVNTNLNFVDREKKVEEFWKENHIFEKSMENRKEGETYTFYDGPPTANGKPHIGHVLTRVIKDMIPRYRTMKGYMVPRSNIRNSRHTKNPSGSIGTCKPRDPRDDMPKPILRSDVLEMKDLKEGMVLKGTVRNVIDFGAFVDIGVHQDGLVHISEMTERFIKHPPAHRPSSHTKYPFSVMESSVRELL